MQRKREILKGCIWSCFSVIGAMLLMGVYATPQANTTQIEIIPPNPIPNDNISIVVSGVWPNGCVPRDPQLTVLSNEIHIATSNEGKICLQAFLGWRLEVSVGSLAAGNYQVI